MKNRFGKVRNYMKKIYNNNFNIDKIINELTYEVDKKIDKSKKIFLSEWFFDKKINEYTGFKEVPLKIPTKIPLQYNFPDMDQNLNSRIKKFHIKEGLPEESFVVFNTEGSTPMITSIILFALQLGFKKIYSIFPLYFNIFKLCDILKMSVIPCNTDLTYEKAGLSLPSKKSFLILTDPIWVIGRHHSLEVFKQLREWQDKTGSVIFVDGSFSYTDWYTPIKKEPSIILNPYLTFRIICPTKALCLHGLRFSYLLCPTKFSKEIARISCSNIGSSCYFSHIQRKRLFSEMVKKNLNPVGRFASDRFKILNEKLLKNDVEFIEPNCGFFMYANLDKFMKKKRIRYKYIWLSNWAVDIPNRKYKSYAKINLISRKNTFDNLIKDLS